MLGPVRSHLGAWADVCDMQVDYESLARLAQTAWEMVEPSYAVIWRDVEIMMDCIWDGAYNPAGNGHFAQWFRSLHALVGSGRWNAGWTRYIYVVEDYQAQSVASLHPGNLSDAYVQILDFVAQTTNLSTFE